MPRPIVLNGRAAARGRLSGVERVAGEVIGRLVELRPDRYAVLRPPAGLSGPRASQAWEQLVLPAQAARRRAALVYSPANLAPLAWPANVVVMHDAAVWRHPAAYSRTYALWHRCLEAACARRARRVIAVSEFSKRELVEVLGLDSGRVSVVPNGVADRFVAGIDPEPVRVRYGLRGPYALTVGTADERKNLGLLGGLARRLAGEGIEFVWAGGERGYLPGGRAGGQVRSLGYVPDEDLPGLYAGARVFVLPSRYEGFGLTCLEAMACGTPVVAADRAALPETCGDAALLVDPDDEQAFAAAALAAAFDEDVRTRLREAGLRHAAGRTWAQAAQATDELLVELAADA